MYINIHMSSLCLVQKHKSVQMTVSLNRRPALSLTNTDQVQIQQLATGQILFKHNISAYLSHFGCMVILIMSLAESSKLS